MKRVLISTLLLSTLLFNAGETTAQNVGIRRNIDNFNQVDGNSPSAGSCDGPDGMPLPLPCLGLFVDGFITTGASNETGLSPENVTGTSRGTTLTYNAGPMTDPAAAAGLIIDPNDVGTLQVQNEQGVFSTANVLWDGEGMGLPDFDMSSYENELAYYNNFVLGVYFIDVDTDVTITVTSQTISGAAGIATLTTNPNRNISGSTVEELFFSLRDPRWTNPGVFQTRIQSIALIFSSESVTDLSVDYFELQKIIPEPSLVWGTVITLGMGMISTYRKRKLL